jgi:hypothetical protein
MTDPAIVETIKQQLPVLLREDPTVRAVILDLTRNAYADRVQTVDRFDRVLDELRRDREAQERKWDEQKREDREKWEAQERKWDEQRREDREKWEAQERKWEEQKQEQEQQRREQRLADERLHEEWNARWEANQAELERLHHEVMAVAKRHDRTVSALGARWGLQSERAFRDALAAILEESFGVKVQNINEIDAEGMVFGRPDQIELDVVITNGQLLLCELKSSVDKAAMHIFHRKAQFYEAKHDRRPDRLIVVSPMIEFKARQLAEQLGIETYGDSMDVPV